MIAGLTVPSAVLGGVLLLAVSAPAAAQDSSGADYNAGPYIGIRSIGAPLASADDVETKNFTGTPLIENDDDQVAGPALVAGYAFKPFPAKVEVEAGYRVRFDLDVRDVMTPAGTVDYESNVSTIQVLVNFVLQWRNSTPFTPFAGGTVGWARNNVDTQRTVLSTQAQVDTDEDTDNIAYGLLAGVEWAFADSWSAEAAYRYINLGSLRSPTFAAGDEIESDNYTSHDVLLTVNYHF